MNGCQADNLHEISSLIWFLKILTNFENVVCAKFWVGFKCAPISACLVISDNIHVVVLNFSSVCRRFS